MLQIKICSGLQDGAVLDNDVKENLTIGNTSICDVFLFGDETTEYQCQFTRVDDTFIRLDEATNASVYLANGQELELGQQLNINSSFRVNDTKILIGTELDSKDWGYELAIEQQLDEAVGFDETDDEMILAADLDQVSDEDGFDFADEIENTKPVITKAKKPTSKFALWKQKIFSSLNIKPAMKKYLWILSISFLVIFAGVIYVCLSASNNQFSKANDVSQMDLLNKQMDNLPEKYSALILTNDANVMVISGIVEGESDVTFIKHYFASFKSLKITYKLITYPAAKNIITTTLAKYALKNIIVSYDPSQGNLTLNGVIDNYDKLSDAEIDINNALPSGVDVNTSNLFDSSVVTKDFLSDISFLGKDQLSIVYNYSLPEINVDGYLDDKTLEQLKTKIDDFKNKYPVVNVNLNIKKLAQVLPFKISMVYAGNPSYIVTDGGEKVFVGGIVKGLSLVSVSNNSVEFMGKYPIIVNLQDLGEWGNNTSSSIDTTETGRNQIINQELSKTKDALEKEQESLIRIQDLMKKVKESDVVSSLKVEADNLVQDIELKQHELTVYSKGNTTNE